MAKTYTRTTPRRARFTKRQLWLGAAVILLLLLLGAWLLKRGSPAPSTPSNTNPVTTKPQANNQSTGGGSTAPSTTPSNKAQSAPTSTAPTGTPPKTPFGNFVSAHHVGMTDTIGSTCSTTPGASCVISFTSNGVTKTLSAKTTDSDGNAYWTWTPQSIGLTAGSWQVTATATLNNQTASANDATALEVQ